MTCMNDTPDLDVESPIPYVLTDLARNDILDYAIAHHPANCHHEWRWAGEGVFVCRKCGAKRTTPRPNYRYADTSPVGRHGR